MNEDARKMYTVRLPEPIASRLEACAARANITPTALIRSVLISRFESSIDSITDPIEVKAPESRTLALVQRDRDCELRQERRHRQLLYEIGKLRSGFLHALDRALSADQVDDIIEAAEETAIEYVASVLSAGGGEP